MKIKINVVMGMLFLVTCLHGQENSYPKWTETKFSDSDISKKDAYKIELENKLKSIQLLG